MRETGIEPVRCRHRRILSPTLRVLYQTISIYQYFRKHTLDYFRATHVIANNVYLLFVLYIQATIVSIIKLLLAPPKTETKQSRLSSALFYAISIASINSFASFNINFLDLYIS